MSDFDTEETEDVEVITMKMEGTPPGETFRVGFAPKSRNIFLEGNLHPLGAASALLQAAKEDVPYISLGAVSALFPEMWLRQACQGDTYRQSVITGICKALRGTA